MSYLNSMDFSQNFDWEGAAFGGADYGNYPAFEFDVPDFEVQSFDLEGAAGGGMPQYFDTTTQQFVDQAGRPFAMGGFGEATERGGVYGPRYGGLEGEAVQPPGSDPNAGPGLFGKGGTLGRGGTADDFLTSPLGRSLIPLLLGGGAMGLGRAMAGSPPRLSIPPFTPSASTMAGENALVNAYSRGVDQTLPEALQLGVAGQRDIAQGLIRDIGAEGPYTDPVRDALQRELMSVLSGGGVSPTTTMRQERETAAERARLFQQLGPDYELTTAGQDTLNKLRQRQNAEQFDERRGTVGSYAPLEHSRGQFAFAAPTARQGQRQQILGSIAPTQPLLNYGGADRANLYNTQLSGQEALASFQNKTQNQRETAAGIGQLVGKVAETITRPPNPFDLYYRNLLSGVTA